MLLKLIEIIKSVLCCIFKSEKYGKSTKKSGLRCISTVASRIFCLQLDMQKYEIYLFNPPRKLFRFLYKRFYLFQ